MDEGRPTSVEGAWRTESYIVNGQPTDVDGVLLLVDGRWSTLYFVTGPAGVWGSAEAGSFELSGHLLSFHHRLMFQGGDARALNMTQAATHIEVCPISIENDTMSIQFPSGNTLRCRRFPRS
jgi:hypothetical protein